MEPIHEEVQQAFDPLTTLTSGLKVPLHRGSIQAHVCVVGNSDHVATVLRAFHQATSFQSVVNWSFAYRLESQSGQVKEVYEDGIDEGCGEKLLVVLRRMALQGLLLLVGRWQDYGETPGLELYGLPLYSILTERAKDLITNLKQAMGLSNGNRELAAQNVIATSPTPQPKNFDFCSLPRLSEPRIPTKYGPNHFLWDSALNRPNSVPNLFSGADVKQWMANDRALRSLPDAELVSLRSLRQPDWRIEEVLRAVSALRGQPIKAGGHSLARWGLCKEALRSPTLRAELLLFDANQVPPALAQEAAVMLEGLDVSEIRRASLAAAALYEWAVGVISWRAHVVPDHAMAGNAKATTLSLEASTIRASEPLLAAASKTDPTSNGSISFSKPRAPAFHKNKTFGLSRRSESLPALNNKTSRGQAAKQRNLLNGSFAL